MIKENDFVQIEYTGKVKDSNEVFDTTIEKVAKDEGIHNPAIPYGQYIICVGAGQILEGLEEELVGKEVGKDYTIKLAPEKAFGKKDGKLLKLIPTMQFKKQNVDPQPGMMLEIDGAVGTVRNVSGGRTIVDFNHPLSGKDIVYEVKIEKKIEDTAEKVKSALMLLLNTKEITVGVEGKKATITTKEEVPKELVEIATERVKKLVAEVEEMEFKQ